MSTTQKILEGLIHNDDFVRKAKPYLKEEYFKDFTEKTIFNLINAYVDKYNKFIVMEIQFFIDKVTYVKINLIPCQVCVFSGLQLENIKWDLEPE